MRVPNEPDEKRPGAFSEFLRLQADFQARVAEESLRYLRRLQGAFSPGAPGTVVVPADGLVLDVSGSPGGAVELRLEVENRQRAYCVSTPVLSPLVDAGGTTWFPEARPSPVSLLLPPGDVAMLTVSVPLPDDLPAGSYRGVLLLEGFRHEGIPVTVTVTEMKKRAKRPGTSSTKSPVRRSSVAKRGTSRAGGPARTARGRA
jgi:hypothetical protein